MPTLFQSNNAKGTVGSPNPPFAGVVSAIRVAMAFPTTAIALDVIELAAIPANCRLLDAVLDADDLDSNGAPTLAFDCGIMTGEFGVNDATRTCNAVIAAASTLGQAGGIFRPTLKTAARDVATDKPRSVGLKVTTAAATAAAGTIGITIYVVSG